MDYLYLNKVAQDVVPLEAAVADFTQLPLPERREALRRLVVMVDQAHPRPTEIEVAIVASGLRPTFTPCVMLTVLKTPQTSPLRQQLTRMVQLPETELGKAFVLLIHVFRVADKRRREDCGSQCQHWWHQDLGPSCQ